MEELCEGGMLWKGLKNMQELVLEPYPSRANCSKLIIQPILRLLFGANCATTLNIVQYSTAKLCIMHYSTFLLLKQLVQDNQHYSFLVSLFHPFNSIVNSHSIHKVKYSLYLTWYLKICCCNKVKTEVKIMSLNAR